jgi:phosphatidate cytidylyltransferase
MKNFLSRFLLVGVALPSLYSAAVYLPQHGHAAIVAVVLVFTAGCGVEIAGIFERRGIRAPAFLLAGLACLPTILLWVALRVFPEAPSSALGVFVAGYGLVLVAAFAPFAFPRKPEDIADSLSKSAARAFPLLYPGLLAASLVLIADLPGDSSTAALIWFAMLVFGNDSAAWAVGMLAGRHRGVSAVSPNKSLEGFAGAFSGSLGAAFLGPALYPRSLSGSSWKLLVLGVLVGTAVIAGDLFESALKRSAGIKDSGSIIPGRGGFLDTFDSILFAAPVFYAAVLFLDLV